MDFVLYWFIIFFIASIFNSSPALNPAVWLLLAAFAPWAIAAFMVAVTFAVARAIFVLYSL